MSTVLTSFPTALQDLAPVLCSLLSYPQDGSCCRPEQLVPIQTLYGSHQSPSVWPSSPLAYSILVLDPQNLLSVGTEVIEGTLGGNGVHQNKTLCILHVKVTHSTELFL